MNRLFFGLLCLFSSGSLFAIGLGELNRQPVLGERLQLEVNLTGTGRGAFDASCYRLTRPTTGNDLPWVKSAKLTVRKGAQAVLEIRSNQIVLDPLLVISVQIGCGHEIARDYILTASPQREVRVPLAATVAPVGKVTPPLPVRTESPVTRPKATSSARHAPPRELDEEGLPVRVRRGVAQHLQANRKALADGTMSDRLMLFGLSDAGDPALRLSPELASANERTQELGEAQRDILRLEFRMLLALHEQALTQLEANAKLRNLDAALLELQKSVAEREKKESSLGPTAANVATTAVAQPPSTTTRPEVSGHDEWSLYALLIAAFSGVAAWLAWKNYQERRARHLLSDELKPVEPEQMKGAHVPVQEIVAEPEVRELPQLAVAPASVDIRLDELDEQLEQNPPEMPFAPLPMDDGIESATVDERFEANPVMELADIMLSFGRVKGAAQALQEYIDANPQEALQPWMRLLNVYRMAGMRNEFEELALNLNRNFNVEIQHWEDKLTVAPGEDQSIDFVLDDIQSDTPPAPKAEHIEDMPRIMQQIIERWNDDDFSAFIYELLRDNRGGARLGFSIGVVEEMLFLIELKENLGRISKDTTLT